MDVYIGLDVSLASTAVCVLDKKGKIVTEAQVASTPEALVSFMAKLPHLLGDRLHGLTERIPAFKRQEYASNRNEVVPIWCLEIETEAA